LQPKNVCYSDRGGAAVTASSTVAVSGGDKTMADKPTLSSEVQNQWARIRGRLRAEVGDAVYRTWIKPITLIDVGGGRVRIAVPTKFLRDWVANNYADRVRALWNAENAAILMVEVVVIANLQDHTIAHLEAEPEVVPKNGAGGEERAEISAPLDPRFTFENFIVGKPNDFAHAAARRVAECSAAETLIVPFNPLFLYGDVGLGKTHLMHAIAWHIRTQNPRRKVIYLSAEKFMYQFIRALRFKDMVSFKDQFRSVDVLMIDDVQFISGKDSTQEEFFHTFNALVDQNRQIIISADKSPHDLEKIEERMRSRLGWGLVADLHPTTYELRLGILAAKAEKMGAPLGEKVLEFLAHKITSNVRELEGALNRIAAHAQFVGRPVTLEAAQELLHDQLRAHDRRITIDEIQKRVAEHYNIKLADMHSARRARAVARPRQVAMYLCKQLTPRSLPEIGRKFGGRDHTTVMHAVKKIEELRSADRGISEDIDMLRRMLET